MAHFGAKVLFPPTMAPALAAGVPIHVRNTFNADAPGTVVSARGAGADAGHPVRGVASVPGVALLTLAGGGLFGMPGVAARLFGALGQRRRLGRAHHAGLVRERHQRRRRARSRPRRDARPRTPSSRPRSPAGRSRPSRSRTDLSILAVVGEGMPQTPGIAGRVFSALGHNGVNVRAVAQGSSERNISVVVSAADSAKALAVVHDGLFLSGAARLNLFVDRDRPRRGGAPRPDRRSRRRRCARRAASRSASPASRTRARWPSTRAASTSPTGARRRDAGEPASAAAFVDRAIALNLPTPSW